MVKLMRRYEINNKSGKLTNYNGSKYLCCFSIKRGRDWLQERLKRERRYTLKSLLTLCSIEIESEVLTETSVALKKSLKKGIIVLQNVPMFRRSIH